MKKLTRLKAISFSQNAPNGAIFFCLVMAIDARVLCISRSVTMLLRQAHKIIDSRSFRSYNSYKTDHSLIGPILLDGTFATLRIHEDTLEDTLV